MPMPMTIAEKILARASGVEKVVPGDVAVVRVETSVLMDMTFLPEGWREVLHVHDPGIGNALADSRGNFQLKDSNRNKMEEVR